MASTSSSGTQSPGDVTASTFQPGIVRSLTTTSQLHAHLASLTARESELTSALNDLVSNRDTLDSAITRLQSLIPQIQEITIEVDGRPAHPGLEAPYGAWTHSHSTTEMEMEQPIGEEGLVDRVSRVWETSERVGGKVRKLDTEVSRVREAAERVTAVLELKNALQSLREAIPKQDWELATRCCKRAMDIEQDVIDGAFAARVVPSSDNPLPPPQALSTLRAQLLETFKEEFQKAAASRDEQSTSRFFKLFPTIGAEEDGLTIYGDFVVNLVKGRSGSGGKPSSPHYYIAHLTSLLESIALIIDQHQSVVDKYYGQGRMKIVVRRLQGEGDRVVRSLVEGWEEERRVGRLISETKQSQFRYLETPVPQQHSTSALSALSSHAQQNIASLPSAASSLLSSYAGAPKRVEETQRFSEEREGPDPRDVDRVLGEMVALSGRWALYRRFVSNRLTDEDAVSLETNGQGDIAPTKEVASHLAIVDSSDGQRAIENMLKRYYEPMEEWYLRTSIEKAHKLDIPDFSTRPYISSVVDDTFYLLKLVLNRLLSAGAISTLNSMRQILTRIIERDYVGVLQKKMEAVYLGGSTGISLVKKQDAEKEKREKELGMSYSVLLNDLDISAHYMERLVEDLTASHAIGQAFLDSEYESVRSELNSFNELSTRMRNIAKTGLDQLFNQLTRPRLRALLEDCYKGVSYVLDEDAYAEAELQDIVRKRFIKGWEPLVEGYKDGFTESNFQLFFSMTVEVLVRPWEKMVMSMRFTELGAIRFDRDVRAITNFLTTQSSFGGAREKFTRLQQISTLLNLDADEDPEDFYGSSGISWRLSKSEFNTIIGLRA